jgi:hypothetical protein
MSDEEVMMSKLAGDDPKSAEVSKMGYVRWKRINEYWVSKSEKTLIEITQEEMDRCSK